MTDDETNPTRVVGDTLSGDSLTAAPDVDDLARIYIRARVNDKWDSLSLRELLDGGNGGQISNWFYGRVMRIIGLEDGAIVTEASVHAMLDLLEHNLGVRIVRVARGFDSE